MFFPKRVGFFCLWHFLYCSLQGDGLSRCWICNRNRCITHNVLRTSKGRGNRYFTTIAMVIAFHSLGSWCRFHCHWHWSPQLLYHSKKGSRKRSNMFHLNYNAQFVNHNKRITITTPENENWWACGVKRYYAYIFIYSFSATRLWPERPEHSALYTHRLDWIVINFYRRENSSPNSKMCLWMMFA